jgi:alanine racemase
MTVSTVTASSILKIDTNAIRENYKILSEISAPARAAPVIKANGYGCGVHNIIAALEPSSPPFYFVATLNEAIAARQFTTRPIAVLNGLFHGAESEYIHHNLTPICASLDDILQWQHYDAPYMWQIDTGMNRLGVRCDQFNDLLSKNFKPPSLILSHFISSEISDDPTNQIQIDRFEVIKQKSMAHFGSGIQFSMGNSSGIFLSQKPHYDITRPGLALFGANPVPTSPNPMKQIVKYETRILRVDNAKSGESAGYNATYIFPHDARLATVSLGYADGIPRYASGKLNLFWNGQACPVRGRISMDLMIVDISNIKGPPPTPGDFMEVIGPHQTIEDVASACGTIGYEILTSLSARSTRIIV